ncbi:response regulator transcription factor [Phenylobacterium sp.]|jgi:DNA-binding NarL/FixJ family response regulator|uniref:response regulator transcription factor n=1 Tax=Phenylobacterium sp. TaxID=1871053 RepID=UPI002F412744
MLRILVADDHEIVRRGLKEVIAAHHDWEVCGEAANGLQALAIARREAPGVAIVDVSLPKLSCPALVGRLADECPSTRILVFSMHDDRETVTLCLAAGALGYALKTDRLSEIEAGIATVGSQRPFLSAQVSSILGEDERFTGRERQVTQLISEGYINKEIARSMGLSVKTVETHRTAAMLKADVRSAPGLIRYAIKQGLIRE